MILTVLAGALMTLALFAYNTAPVHPSITIASGAVTTGSPAARAGLVAGNTNDKAKTTRQIRLTMVFASVHVASMASQIPVPGCT
jgi:hypothetical protein